MSNKTGVTRLLQIAGEKRGLLLISGILSALSAIGMLISGSAAVMRRNKTVLLPRFHYEDSEWLLENGQIVELIEAKWFVP